MMHWIFALALSSGCGAPPGTTAPPAAAGERPAWLTGDEDARFAQVERHLRGMDMAMVEVGYRYRELGFAGEDGNWSYAAYQSKKLRLAMRNGVERRPRRAASAELLWPALDQLDEVIAGSDPAGFSEAMIGLQATCNSCHVAEDVGFMVVVAPDQRASPIRGDAAP